MVYQDISLHGKGLHIYAHMIPLQQYTAVYTLVQDVDSLLGGS